MDTVETVLKLCNDRNVKVSRLEKDLGFGNGYIKSLKRGKIPVDRVAMIAEYFNVPINTFTDGNEKKPATDGDGPYPTNPGRVTKEDAIKRLLPRLSEQELEDL